MGRHKCRCKRQEKEGTKTEQATASRTKNHVHSCLMVRASHLQLLRPTHVRLLQQESSVNTEEVDAIVARSRAQKPKKLRQSFFRRKKRCLTTTPPPTCSCWTK